MRPGADIHTGIKGVDYFIGEYVLVRYTFALRTAREYGAGVEEAEASDDDQADANDGGFASSQESGEASGSKYVVASDALDVTTDVIDLASGAFSKVPVVRRTAFGRIMEDL